MCQGKFLLWWKSLLCQIRCLKRALGPTAFSHWEPLEIRPAHFLKVFLPHDWTLPEGNEDPIDLGVTGMLWRTQALLCHTGSSANLVPVPVYNSESEVFTSLLLQIEQTMHRSWGKQPVRIRRKCKTWLAVGKSCLLPAALTALRMLCSISCIDGSKWCGANSSVCKDEFLLRVPMYTQKAFLFMSVFPNNPLTY